MAQQLPSPTSSSPLAHFRDSLRYTLQDAAADPSSDSMPLETLNDQDDSPLGSGSFATSLPRRNHTISGSARNKTKRLPQHFEQPSVKPNRGPVSPLAESLPLSPNRNSLKEITGTENEHDEWEKAIKDEHSSAAEDLASLTPSSSSSSASGSLVATAAVRRHQSLNHHHLNRSLAGRLSSRPHLATSPMAPPSPPASLTGQLQSALAARDFSDGPSQSRETSTTSQPSRNLSASADTSPISPSAFSSAPWQSTRPAASPENSGSASPSRYIHKFSSSQSFAGGRSSSPGGQSGTNGSVILGGDLMDAHTVLQKLSLGEGDSGTSSGSSGFADTSTGLGPPPISVKKRPSLITNPDLLANGRHGHSDSNASSMGFSHHPPGHSRIQSTDSVLNRPGENELEYDSFRPRTSQISDLMQVPHTAAPTSWAAKDDLVGSRYQPLSPQIQSAVHQQQHRQGAYQSNTRPPIPSQWGMGLSPNGDREQITIALSMALAEQQQKTAMLEAALRANGGTVPSDLAMQQSQQSPPPQASQYNRSMEQSSFGPSHSRHASYEAMGGMSPRPLDGHGSPANFSFGSGPAGPLQQTQPVAPSADLLSLPGRPDSNPARLDFNPVQYELSPPSSTRFLVIKSFTEDDVHRSIRHGIWASTDKGNQRLDRVYKECHQEASERNEEPKVLLFFSVNGSGHFCGMAQMMSEVDFNASSNVWAQEGKWKGSFHVKHIFVKDIPNRELRHIKLDGGVENKSVTQSRDTQELSREAGLEMLKIIHDYRAQTSLLNGIGLGGGEGNAMGGPPTRGGSGHHQQQPFAMPPHQHQSPQLGSYNQSPYRQPPQHGYGGPHGHVHSSPGNPPPLRFASGGHQASPGPRVGPRSSSGGGPPPGYVPHTLPLHPHHHHQQQQQQQYQQQQMY